jgi:hypothetical protein
MPATVKDATKQARMKQTHHQVGVGPSMMPQILSVIQEKLRLLPTSTARGSTAGLTSCRIAGAGAADSTWAAISYVLRSEWSSVASYPCPFFSPSAACASCSSPASWKPAG